MVAAYACITVGFYRTIKIELSEHIHKASDVYNKQEGKEKLIASLYNKI